MAQFLAIQIQLGRLTIEQVPTRYRPEVEALLEQAGWVPAETEAINKN